MLHRMQDDLVEHERVMWAARAHKAAERVESQFKALSAAGKMKDLNRSYRLYREGCRVAGEKAVSWPAYALQHKERMVRILAVEQIARARAGRDPVL